MGPSDPTTRRGVVDRHYSIVEQLLVVAISNHWGHTWDKDSGMGGGLGWADGMRLERPAHSFVSSLPPNPFGALSIY